MTLIVKEGQIRLEVDKVDLNLFGDARMKDAKSHWEEVLLFLIKVICNLRCFANQI